MTEVHLDLVFLRANLLFVVAEQVMGFVHSMPLIAVAVAHESANRDPGGVAMAHYEDHDFVEIMVWAPKDACCRRLVVVPHGVYVIEANGWEAYVVGAYQLRVPSK